MRVLKDKTGRAYARLSAVKVGDTLECDGGFTCLSRGERRVVQNDPATCPPRNGNGLYIACRDGKHFLDGQLDFDGSDALIGLYPVKPAKRGRRAAGGRGGASKTPAVRARSAISA